MTARVIIYALPGEMIFAARMAERLMSPDYEWPNDGIALFQYGDGRDLMFSARKNKGGFTIYSQQLPAAPLSRRAAK